MTQQTITGNMFFAILRIQPTLWHHHWRFHKWHLRNKLSNSILITFQFWVVLLIGWSKFSYQSEGPSQAQLGSDASSVWNFFAHSWEIILQGKLVMALWNVSYFLRLYLFLRVFVTCICNCSLVNEINDINSL